MKAVDMFECPLCRHPESPHFSYVSWRIRLKWKDKKFMK